MTVQVTSTTGCCGPRRYRRTLPLGLLGYLLATSCFGGFAIDSVSCLDTIVKDSEYLDGTKTPNDSLLTNDDMPNDKEQQASTLGRLSDDTVTDNGSSTNTNQHLDRLWGSSGTGSATIPSKTEASDDEMTEDIIVEGKQHQGRWGSAQQQATMSMKGKISDSHVNPPEGFAITARVYIDSKDKLAHFDVMDETNGEVNSTVRSNRIMLPYYDCGVSGATTAALPVKQIHFRHALSSPTTVYVDQSSLDSKVVLHPVLAVALSSLTVELDSGAHMNFVAGDAILFEDTIRPGHLLTVSKGSTNLTVLLITLPNRHHHIGKQYLSIKAALKVYTPKSTPCLISKPKDDIDNARLNFHSEDAEFETISTTDSSFNDSSNLAASPDDVINSSTAIFSDTGRRIRIVLLGTIAFSLSTLMADFLGRTAPLWLAVGVGGTCFVLGSTYAITTFSDFLYTTLSLWHERRKLEQKSRSNSE